MSHSPGPWITYDTQGHGEIDAITLPGMDGEILLTAWDCSIADPEIVDANLRLAAAAPDLLYSLNVLSAFVSVLCEKIGLEDDFELQAKDKDTGKTSTLLFSELIEGVTHALAKAQGKESA